MTTRRVVTGFDAQGRSVILQDGPPPLTQSVFHKDFILETMWRQESLPAVNGAFSEPCTSLEQRVTKTGNMLRITHFPPDKDYIGNMPSEVKSGNVTMTKSAGGSLMHTTETVDYIIILSGEIYLVMEEGETLLKAGDVVIQRGTAHGWSNRSDGVCVMAAVTNGALPV